MSVEHSCGAVVFTREGGGIRYVIIHSLEGISGFPKGHMEPGETEEQTALREIREEVGLNVTIIPGFRHEASYPLPKKPGVTKRVTYFLAEYAGQEIHPQPEELAGAALMGFEEAMKAFDRENNRAVLAKAKESLEKAE